MNIIKILDRAIYGFFMIFFMIYIGKFGIANFILEGNTRWIHLVNIGIWFVLEMFCIDKFFASFKEVKE